MKPLALLMATAFALGVAGCAQPPVVQPGLIEIIDRPAERALLQGMRAYDDGQYAQAEQHLTQALQGPLASAKDQAAAHKYLAFIACSSNRLPACEAAFRAAQKADPAFALSRSELGHPAWGPVYKRLTP